MATYLLDGIGSVELLGTFGDDLTVVNAARVSFAKESVVMDDKDAKLINYLAKHNHITPFFHPQVRLRLKMPIYVAREWFRHTVGFARNEVSRRYVDTVPEYYMPELRERDINKKQGSKSNIIGTADFWTACIEKNCEETVELYGELIDNGVAPEVARGILPQSMYTEFIETASLYAYIRLCKLRMDPQAQAEIRKYAEAVSNMLIQKFPVSWAAFQASESG
jgi:thymidylate synthase (FAD)